MTSHVASWSCLFLYKETAFQTVPECSNSCYILIRTLQTFVTVILRGHSVFRKLFTHLFAAGWGSTAPHSIGVGSSVSQEGSVKNILNKK